MPWCAALDAHVCTPPTFAVMDDGDPYQDVTIDFFSDDPDLNSNLHHVLQKRVTNTSYLKSMYINQQFTRAFIPSLDDIFRDKATKFHAKHMTLMNVDGRTWGVDFEVVKSRKQLHCRLAKGWSQFCRDNGVALNDCLVFQHMVFDGQCTLLVSICKAD